MESAKTQLIFALLNLLFIVGSIKPSFAQLVSVPYSIDFESGTTGWSTTSSDTLSEWEFGTPNFAATTGAHSGINCWDINLNSAYGDSANCILYTPTFDISGNIGPRISFWLNYNTENGWDGTRLEYTVDSGITWNVLGAVNDPYAINWYNSNSLNSSLLPGWMSSSLGWKKSEYTLFQLIGFQHVQFRFIFTSDPSVIGDGISIDDFSITTIIPNDIELEFISTGLSTYAIGLTTDSILFSIRNKGTQNISNFNYEYSLNGVQQMTATNFGILPPGGTLILFLPGFVFPQGSVNLCGKISMANDNDTTNNSFCISRSGVPYTTLNWFDNFDNAINLWTPQNVSGANTYWHLGSPNYGATNSTYSPPKCWDINLFTGYSSNAECYLYSPLFDIRNSVHPRIEFWQNRNTNFQTDGAHLEYQSGFDSTWHVLGKLADPNGLNWYTNSIIFSSQRPGWSGNSNGWKKCEYNLDSANVSNTIRFRFVFNSNNGNGQNDGISIDNFKISHVLNNDASLFPTSIPMQSVQQGIPVPIQVHLKNNGLQQLTSLTIKYSLNGGTPISTSWMGSLPYDSMVIVTLPTFIPIVGINSIQAYIDWPVDLDHENDTITITTFGILSINLPYSEDFESGTSGWYGNQGGLTNWEYGLPNFGTLNSAHSGSNCWDINLTTNYFNLANAILYSPIINLTSNNIITLQFWINYSSESGADGMYIEYTTDEINWQRLGNIGDPAGTNWYNSNLTSGNQGWCGSSVGWQQSSYVYTGSWGVNYFRLRFRFISDFNVIDAGVSLDDISITGVTSINENNFGSNFIIFPNPVNEELIIQVLNQKNSIQQIDLRSIEGKIVYVEENPSTATLKIPTATFSPGIYLLRFVDESGANSVKRVVIQH